MTHWGLSPGVARPLCGALLHFLWQGVALALLFSAALGVARQATTRYVLGLITLALMAAAPIATFVILRSPPSPPAMAAIERRALTPSPTGAGAPRLNPQFEVARQRQSSPLPEGAEVWVLEFWLAGVAILSVRGLGGLWLLERVRRRETRPLNADLAAMARALERRLGLRRMIGYLECRHLTAPAVLGWVRPVVLLPVSTVTGLSPEQLRAVIAHELAHIWRHDAFVNLFQMGVETLLFYHPAVWWVSAQVRAERENCCDDVAVSVCGGLPDYARALMLMEEWRDAPRLAMAANGSPLRARVLRLLGLEMPRSRTRSVSTAVAALCLVMVLLAGTGLFSTAGLARGRVAVTPGRRLSALSAPANSRPGAPAAVRPQPTGQERGKTSALGFGLPFSAAGPQTAAPTSEQDERPEVAPAAGKESYIAGLRAAGLKDLTVDQLISLKVQGVTPDYVRQIHAAGLDPTVDELMGMKVQGVTPDYIRGMRARGLKPTVDQLIGMKVQGVTPEYLASMHDLGMDLTAEEAVGMRVQGVTAEYIRALHAEGLNPQADELIGLRVQGVTPEYVRQVRALGLKPGVDELIGLRVQGVTPEYISQMRATGLAPNVDQLIGLRVQGVTPELVRALQGAGLGSLNADDYIVAKQMGITPEFVTKVRSHGVQGLTLDKLIALKRAGVF